MDICPKSMLSVRCIGLFWEVRSCQIEMEPDRKGKGPEPVPAMEKEQATDVARGLDSQVEITGVADKAVAEKAAVGKDAGSRDPAVAAFRTGVC